MLGSALRRSFLSRNIPVFEVSESFEWLNLERLRAQFKVSTERFFLGLTSDDSWEIYWACGVGTMSSSARAMSLENECFMIFLDFIKAKLVNTESFGVIAYSSSAGALYAGCLDFEITEESTVLVINEYGCSKLFQESQLEKLAFECRKVRILIARFSTLYGPGQGFGKGQGLITHIVRSVLRNHPVKIFVPLTTTRDYIYVDDAARQFIHFALETKKREGLFPMIKIIAFERSISIAEILSTLNRLTKKRVGIFCSRSDLTHQYPSRVSYRSKSRVDNETHLRRRSLTEGIHTLLETEKLRYLRQG